MESEEETKRGHRVATPCLGAASPGPAPRGGVAPPGLHRPRLAANILPTPRKPSRQDHPYTKSSADPPPPKTSFEGKKFLFRHPTGMGIAPRSHLHQLHRLHFDSMMVCE